MWNRIYLTSLAACSVIMAAISYYAWSWLQSIGAPQTAIDGYLYHSGLSWTFLWISAVALLILANFVLGKYCKSWAMWATLVYFGVFIIVRYFVLEQSFFQYKKTNGLWEGGFSAAPVAAVILCITAATIVYANHFVLVRLRQRIYPEKESDAETVDQISEDVPKASEES